MCMLWLELAIVSIDLCFKHLVPSLWYHFEGRGPCRIWKQVIRGERWRLFFFLIILSYVCVCVHVQIAGALEGQKRAIDTWERDLTGGCEYLMWIRELNPCSLKEQYTCLISEPSFQTILKVLFSCILCRKPHWWLKWQIVYQAL